MTEKNQKMPFGQLVLMAICASFLIVLFRSTGFGGVLGGAIGGGSGALLGVGLYYLFSSGKE
mgnify:FL=1